MHYYVYGKTSHLAKAYYQRKHGNDQCSKKKNKDKWKVQDNKLSTVVTEANMAKEDTD